MLPRAVLIRNVTLLGLVLLVTLASQIPFTMDAVRCLQGTYPERPFAMGSPWPAVVWVDASASSAGMRIGDRAVSIDGRVPHGRADLARPLAARHPGEILPVTVERDGRPIQLRIFLGRADLGVGSAVAVINWLLIPWLSIVLGFWVTGVRIGDFRAWLLLGLLLGFSQLARSDWLDLRAWPLAIAMPGIFFRELDLRAWGACMMLFGIYFPRRFELDRRAPWIKWIFLAPLAATALWDGLRDSLQVADYNLAARLFPVEVPEWIQIVLLFITCALFFVPLGIKYRDPAESADDRRRLQLLYMGASLAMTPAFLVWIFMAVAYHRQPSGVLEPIMLTLMGLFPLTLAYVIVVERAMDVRVVIRQGIQYALARRGVRAAQIVLTTGILLVAISYAGAPAVNRPGRITLIASGVILVFMLRRLAERLSRWVDRRFFREAYNSEQILSDLGEQVRTILDKNSLLETVVRKISESLHVERIAVFLAEGDVFRPALAAGYALPLDVAIPADSAPLQQLRRGREPFKHVLPEIGSELLLPLASQKELLGFISLGPKKSEEPYSSSDTRLLRTVAAQTGLALENSRLSAAIAAEMAQRELLHREIEIASEVQQRLFPQILPEVPALSYAGHCRPARGVGGDYYDFLALAGGRLGIAIGDVSGKGVPAALLMASLQASVRGQSQAAGNVAELIDAVNRLVFDASAENRYATFFYARFDPPTRRLIYTNAGHNPPMVLRGGEVLRLETGGPPVGLFRVSRYLQAEIDLQLGDLLLLFTDGISEAENPAEEEWGEDSLLAAARACEGLAPDLAIARILECADRFAAGAPQHDDMTLVVARVL
jgi:sigma-B regulation protein RsbU (phosphoserine phosphatase)